MTEREQRKCLLLLMHFCKIIIEGFLLLATRSLLLMDSIAKPYSMQFCEVDKKTSSICLQNVWLNYSSASTACLITYELWMLDTAKWVGNSFWNCSKMCREQLAISEDKPSRVSRYMEIGRSVQNSGSVQRISRPISMYRDTLKPRTVCPHHIIADGPKILGFITFEAKLSLRS